MPTSTGDSNAGVAINPDAFKEGFSVDALLAFLAKDVLKGKLGSRSHLDTGVATLSAKASLEKVQKLLSTLDRCDAHDMECMMNYHEALVFYGDAWVYAAGPHACAMP